MGVKSEAPANDLKANKTKKKRREKCDNCRRCWGFFDFLKTSWKIFKEFSADTSIHGGLLCNLRFINE